MGYSPGDKVVVADKGKETGFRYKGNTGITIGTHATVVNHEKAKVTVSIGGKEFNFDTLEIMHEQRYYAALLQGVGHPILDLSSTEPVLIIGGQVYSASGDEIAGEFYIGGKRHELFLTGSLDDIEQFAGSSLSQGHRKIAELYLSSLNLEDYLDIDRKRMRVLEILVNDVFPLFDGTIYGDKPLYGASKPGINNVEMKQEKKKSPEKQLQKRKQEILSEKLIERELTGLIKPEWNMKRFPKTYGTETLIGKISEGRDLALVDGHLYNLVEVINPEMDFVTLNGKHYSFRQQKKADMLWERMFFDISREMRAGAFNDIITSIEEQREKLVGNSKLLQLMGYKQYAEQDYAFIMRDEEGKKYSVLLEVPRHILVDHKTGLLYLFKDCHVAVNVELTSGVITVEPRTYVHQAGYDHPFVGLGDSPRQTICMGSYDFSKLDMLEPGVHIATLLSDARRILLKGLLDKRIKPVHSIDQFESNLISGDYARQINVPITNQK
jgi:hypothetical protein